MPRKQQRGAGLFDAFSSDPSKKKEANLKKIADLEKESETKCEEIKKLNAAKIEKLNADNTKLDEMIKQKNAEPKSSGFLSGFFSGDKDEAAVPGKNDSGFFSGLFSGSDGKAAAGSDGNAAAGSDVNTAANVGNPMLGKNLGGRQEGGKKRKSQRRRKSKARKSAKK